MSTIRSIVVAVAAPARMNGCIISSAGSSTTNTAQLIDYGIRALQPSDCCKFPAEERRLGNEPNDAIRAMMASAILAAVANGERLPLPLRNLACALSTAKPRGVASCWLRGVILYQQARYLFPLRPPAALTALDRAI